MMKQTGCDGIMIGRAARGNPWIFRQVSEYMNNGTIIAPPSVEKICQMIKRHAKGLCEIKRRVYRNPRDEKTFCMVYSRNQARSGIKK